jgi:hypothetical protein
MLDSGASHNLMPKVVMEKLGLEIIRTYHNLYSFGAIKLKCDELIKDMVLTLAQLPVKSIMMDVVVVDVPANYCMLLSIKWAHNMGCTMNMDILMPLYHYLEVKTYGCTKRKKFLMWLVTKTTL